MPGLKIAASSRGHANHGWLDTYHTFSFAQYFNPNRMNFGALRVLNDDRVAPGNGFGTHPHENMEIISIPLSGKLQHEDNMGTGGIIQTGEVQVMSAGTGITHSEQNASNEEEVSFLQIWIFPNQKDHSPRYGQESFSLKSQEWSLLVQPGPREDTTAWIHQHAWLRMGSFASGSTGSWELSGEVSSQGLFLMVLEGSLEVEHTVLQARNAMDFKEQKRGDFKVLEDCKLLSIEVPLHL